MASKSRARAKAKADAEERARLRAFDPTVEILTAREAAIFVDVDRRLVVKALDAGEIEGRKHPGAAGWRMTRAAVKAWATRPSETTTTTTKGSA